MDSYDCIELTQDNATSVVKFKDQKVMDPARIEKLGLELQDVAARNSEEMLIDFNEVRFISSAALSKLVVLERKLKLHGKKLRLCNLQPEVRDLFSLARLDTLFSIRDH
jgi:anti-sigma B factor antagonist